MFHFFVFFRYVLFQLQQYYNSSYNSKHKQREIINITKIIYIIYITGKKKMKTEIQTETSANKQPTKQINDDHGKKCA